MEEKNCECTMHTTTMMLTTTTKKDTNDGQLNKNIKISTYIKLQSERVGDRDGGKMTHCEIVAQPTQITITFLRWEFITQFFISYHGFNVHSCASLSLILFLISFAVQWRSVFENSGKSLFLCVHSKPATNR